MTRAGASPLPAGCAVGMDVGGTKIAGGVLDVSGRVIEQLVPIACPTAPSDATLFALKLPLPLATVPSATVGAV